MMVDLRKYRLLLVSVWTLILAVIFGTVVYLHHCDTIEEAVQEARNYYTLNLQYRAWNSRLGGLYADADKVSPNPYLTVPERDVTMSNGKRYTLVNPAYMTRMVFNALRSGSSTGVISKVTSLEPINPHNAPDQWESAALRTFDQSGATQQFEKTIIDQQPYLRFIAPFVTETSCLNCHGHQGYKVGDIRGGISIAVPLSKYLTSEAATRRNLLTGFLVLWVFGCSGILLSSRKYIEQADFLHNYRERLNEKIVDLEAANGSIKRLSDNLTIVMDGIPALVAHVDCRQRYLYVNRSYARWVGYTQAGLVGRKVEEVIGAEVYAGSRTYIEAALQGTAGELERVVGCNGESRVQQINYVPQYDDQQNVVAFFTFIIDVTERAQAQSRLRESEERFRQVAKTADEFIWEVDTAGRFRYASAVAEKIFGYSPGEMVDKLYFYDLFAPEVKDELKDEAFRIFREKQSFKSFRNKNVRKNGEIVIVETSGTPVFDSSGELIGYRGTDVDVTNRLNLEDQLRQSQKMEAIGMLAGGIAHDFNNILQAISTFGFLLQIQLKEQNLPDMFAEEIVKAGKRAAELTGGLLAFSRKQMLAPKLTNLNSVVEEAHQLLSRLAPETIEFSISYDPDTLDVVVDGGQVQQVLINLVTNACDAMPDGGVLTVRTGRAVIDAAFIAHHGFGKPGNYATITVTDSGCGLDERTKSHIFEPFFTTKEMGRGTGLGLSIVYGIVKQHDGFISVDSTPAKGTSFIVYFQEKFSQSSEGEADDEQVVPPGGRETILVVEDEQMVRTALASILRHQGYEIIEATDGESAMELFRERSRDIHLVITDMVMPKMSGREACSRLREIRQDVPVLFVTGYAGKMLQTFDQLEERTSLLMKPVDPLKLLEKVRELLLT
jgi:PAS domain S-box-containing protein